MHVLVTAASRHGATGEIADAIAQRLREHGLQVTVADPAEVTGLESHGAAVVGSAVYAGHWLGPAKELVGRLEAELSARPVWLFSSGPVGDPPRPDDDAVQVDDLVAATGARGHRVFAGKIDRDALGFAERAIVRALKVPGGDFRDWDAITTWADHIAVELGDRAG